MCYYFIFFILIFFSSFQLSAEKISLEGLPIYYWKKSLKSENFGDYLSLKLVERIIGGRVEVCNPEYSQKLLAIGSVLICAKEGDVLWGTGMNAKRLDLDLYEFKHLDVRALRGPLTRKFLEENFNIEAPPIYGDPALLLPFFFPEFKKSEQPEYEYIFIPHYTEIKLFPKSEHPYVVYPTEPWRSVIRKILNSKLVLSSSLHGLVVAEAYGIPARYVRLTEHEALFKYQDYYLGTNRPDFKYATSIKEGLEMGGELSPECDLQQLYNAFPFEYWPQANFKKSLYEGF